MIPFEQAVSLKKGKGLVQSAQISILFYILICAFQSTKNCCAWTNAELQAQQACGNTAWEIISMSNRQRCAITWDTKCQEKNQPTS